MLRKYILRRFFQMVLVLFVVSIVSFIAIELPPGDYLTILQAQLEEQQVTREQIEGTLKAMKERFSLDQPSYVRYFRWIAGVMQGDFGYSFFMRDKVGKLIGRRIVLTMVISILTLIFTLTVAIPIGVYSAVHQYSASDYFFTFLGFIGLAIPNFLLALVVLFIAVVVFGATNIGGLFSPEYILVSWSVPKVIDLLKHLWLPVLIVGTAGTAATTRVVRAKMLDTLGEPYIQTARMKGISERRVILKHALRVAINPVITGVGLSFPSIISGATITAVVLTLPTTGPLLLRALMAEDMYLACSMLLLLTFALVIGNFLADLTLAWLDPRISYG